MLHLRGFISIAGSFWRQHPALLYSLGVLLGLHAAFHWTPLLLIPCGITILPLAAVFIFPSGDRLRSRIILFLMTTTGVFFYIKTAYLFPKLSEEGISGTAEISIKSVSSSQKAFGRVWSYCGTLGAFIPDQPVISEVDSGRINPIQSSIAYGVPYHLQLPENAKVIRPKANRRYRFRARLKMADGGHYFLSVSPKDPWQVIEGTWSFAEYRYELKSAVKAYIQKRILGSRAGVFLAGIATGDFDDRLMLFEFGRFGLQHIMAISGFHFAFIATILSGLLRFWMRPRLTAIALIVFLTTYFVFLGCGASIMRAWVAILVALLGSLIGKHSVPLNTMGIAIIAIFCADPLLCCSSGFELSFLSTAAILFFFSGSDFMLQKLWKKRSLSTIAEMNSMNQHAFLILTFFRQALALTCAVHLVALPMMLFYFHKFPLMGVVYNLFFPFMVSGAMLLLLLGIVMDLIMPPVAGIVHLINSHYTQFMLNFTSNMPSSVDVIWRIEKLPESFVLTYLCCLLWCGIFIKSYLIEKREEQHDLMFL